MFLSLSSLMIDFVEGCSGTSQNQTRFVCVMLRPTRRMSIDLNTIQQRCKNLVHFYQSCSRRPFFIRRLIRSR